MARRQALAEQLAVVEAALEEARRRVDELEEAQDALLALLAELDGAPDDDGTTTELDEPVDGPDGPSRHGLLEPRLVPVGPEPPRPALPPVLEDADEETAPPQPQATDAERHEERRLGTELGIELEAMLDAIEAQIRPLENKVCFALRAYARTLLVATYRARSRRDSGFITPPEMENIVCGGATQAGKTMFVVVGIVAAHVARVPCVVVTTTVRGRDSLHAKVLGFLGQLADGGAGERATCLRATGGSSEKATDALLCALGGSTVAEQCDRGALFVSDTPQQLQRATRLLQSLRDMRANQRTACAGQFLLIIDEADAMQRTDGEEREPIQLERRLITLLGGKQDADGVWRALGDNPADKSKASLLAEQFWGPQACVSISATLLPVFLRVHRGAQRAKDKAAEAAHAAAEAAAQAAADGGVVPAPPVVAALPPAILHPFYTSEKMGDYVGVMSDLWLPFQADCPDGSKADAFLPDRALNLKNRGVDEGGLVMALYKHAVERPHSLLLDVTVVRVNADNNIFEKARDMRRVFPTLAIMVVYGMGCEIFLPTNKGGGSIRLLKRDCELEVSELLTLMEHGGDIPSAKDKSASLGRLPWMCDSPFAVIGYSMMIRGDSFRSNYRVPTHMVNHLSKAMSVDRLVQSAGRATFQGKKFLQDNGFDRVSVLMLEMDYRTVRAYMALMRELRQRIVVEKQTLEQCFAEDAKYPEEIYVLADKKQKRGIGNRNEALFLDPNLFEGQAERDEAERLEQEEKADAKEAKKLTKQAEAAAVAAVKREERAAAKRELEQAKAQADAQAKEAKKQAKQEQAAAPGTDRKRKREKAADADIGTLRSWAAKHAAALPAKVIGSRLLEVQALGTLRAEPAFRARVDGAVLLLPVGYAATRGFKDWRAPGGAKCIYLQEIRLHTSESGAAAPLFVVRHPGGGADAECASHDPGLAWDAVAKRVADAEHAAGGASGAAAPPPSPGAAAGAADAFVADAAAASDAAPGAAQRRAKTQVVRQQGYKNFGLQSPYVQALIELLPRPPQCAQEPLPYVSLEARTLLTATTASAAAPAAVAGMAQCSTPPDARGTPLGSDEDSDDGAGFGVLTHD